VCGYGGGGADRRVGDGCCDTETWMEISAMQVKIENNELVIRISLEKPKPSSSGKTLIVASTGGNYQSDVEVNGKPVFVGVNAYIKK